MDTKKDLSKLTSHGIIKQSYECDKCGKILTNYTSFNRHKRQTCKVTVKEKQVLEVENKLLKEQNKNLNQQLDKLNQLLVFNLSITKYVQQYYSDAPVLKSLESRTLF
jgi:hypothetical protein